MEPRFRVGPASFTTAAGTANTTLTPALPALDLSRRQAILMEMAITAALTDSADTISAKLQFTRDGSIWHTAAHTDTVVGNATVSSTAPEIRRVVLSNRVALPAPGQAYEPGGSAGATDLVAGSVRDQPFPGKVFLSGVWVPSWRVVLVQTDADNDATFTGTITLLVS
jgi:hypothetical protein